MPVTNGSAKDTVLRLSRDLASEIALRGAGRGWTASLQDAGSAYAWLQLHGSKGELLSLRVAEGRVKVHASWPRAPRGRHVGQVVYPPGEIPKNEITVAATKPTATIAKEIVERLLSTYLPAFDTALDRIRSTEEFEDAKIGLKRELASILGTDPGEGDGPLYTSLGDVRVESEVHGDNCVKLELRVNAETARRILKLLVAEQMSEES